MRTEQRDRLLRKLEYQFSDPELLTCALTHRSMGSRNNERLEFLGDAVLGYAIAAELYNRFPTASEGVLSRLRSSLVKGETLAELARDLQLGDHLLLGSGELKSGGYRRNSILAGALEGVMGAIYLDGGYEDCYQWIIKLYKSRLESISPDVNLKDPKTRLQEYLQSKKLELPRYTVVSVDGQAHDHLFRVDCYVSGLDLNMQGAGFSRRKAEQDAAQKILETIESGQ
ncbi:MAG: ribonuclease III [Gammaproteobacteria bacterium]|nr:ribonuclease III [Gammaproteobacteria bacterium]